MEMKLERVFFILIIICIVEASNPCTERTGAVCPTLTNKKCRPSKVTEAHCTRSEDCTCPKVCCVTNDCKRTCVAAKPLVEARSNTATNEIPSLESNPSSNVEEYEDMAPGEMMAANEGLDAQNQSLEHINDNATTMASSSLEPNETAPSSAVEYNVYQKITRPTEDENEHHNASEVVPAATSTIAQILASNVSQPETLDTLPTAKPLINETKVEMENVTTKPTNASTNVSDNVTMAVTTPKPPSVSVLKAPSSFLEGLSAKTTVLATPNATFLDNLNNKVQLYHLHTPDEILNTPPDDVINNRDVIVQLMSLLPKLLRNIYRGRTVPSLVVKMPTSEYMYVPPLPGYDSNKRNMAFATSMFNPKRKALGMPWYKYLKNTRPFGPLSPGQYPYPIFMVLTHPGDVLNRFPEETLPIIEEFFFRMNPPVFKPKQEEGFVLRGPLLEEDKNDSKNK